MGKKESKKIKSLLVILLVSVCLFVGILLYSYHWETISRINWKDTLFPEPETLEVYYEIAGMSHTMPILTRTAQEGTRVLEVPLISQTTCGYQTGCELVSGAMAMQYYGLDVTPQDLYDAIDKVPSPWGAEGKVSPNECFIGDPNLADGFGCYAKPLVTAMNRLMDERYHAVDISGTSLEDIERHYLQTGYPVILWATIHMSEPTAGSSWILQDGTQFQWIAGEHCLVLVGMDEECYYFNDPNVENDIIGYPKELVEERYQDLGKQAIIISQ